MNKCCDEKHKTPGSVDAALDGSSAALNELSVYQSGAIVSRTLLETPACCVTLFAFDEGQGLKEHTAPFHALVHVIDGQAEFTIGGTAHTLAVGDVLVMPPHVPHAVRAMTKFRMVLTMARDEAAA
jgi:quercetin dioxygenase-like cupin family protein